VLLHGVSKVNLSWNLLKNINIIDEDEFWRVTDSFRGNMWQKNGNGDWKLKNPIWEQEPVEREIDIKNAIEKANIAIEE